MHVSKVILLSGTAAVLSGCTTSLQTRPVGPEMTRIDGVEYWLPALELTMPVTRRLIDCEQRTMERAEGKVEVVLPKFEFKVEPVQDLVPAEAMVMNYADMARPWKTSEFAVEWHDNRMLKKVNAKASDKSGEIALEVLKAGIGVAKLAGGIIPPAGAAEASTPSCPAEVATRKNLQKQKKARTAELAVQTALVEAFRARDAESLSEDEKNALGAALAESARITKAIGELDKKLAEADRILAYTETLRWRPASAAGSTSLQQLVAEFTLPDTPTTAEEVARTKWVKKLFGMDDISMLGRANEGCEDIDGDGDGIPDSFRCNLERSLSLVAGIQPLDGGLAGESTAEQRVAATRSALGISAPKSRARSSSRDHVDGLITRIPVSARFFACSGSGEACHRSSTTRLFDEAISIPQLGRYGVLPFSNGPGQDNTLEATFAENGLLTSVSYKEEKSSALVMAQTLNQGAEALLGYSQEVRAYREAEKGKLEGAALKAAKDEVALLEQQARIVELQASLDPANIELARQAQLLSAQLAQATTRRDILTIEGEIERLEIQLALQPENLSLLAEKERLETLAAQLRSRVAIAESCASLGQLEECS